MKRNLLIVFLLICFSAFLYSQNAKQHIKSGTQFVENGFYEAAIEQFSKAISLEPENADAYKERAVTYQKLDSTLLAANDFSKAGFLAKDADMYYQAAEIYYNMEMPKQALAQLTKSLEIKDKHYESQLLLTKILIDKNEYGKAYEEAQKLVDIKDYAIGYYYKGLIEKKLKMYQAAENSFEKSIIKDKNFLDAFLAQAELQLELNKIEYALENCSYVIFMNSKSAEAYLIRSKIWMKKKDFQNAITDISKAISIEPSNDNLLFTRGNYYLKYEQYQNAINDYTKAILINDHNTGAYKNRAQAFEQIKNTKLAIHDYNKLKQIVPAENREYHALINEKLFALNEENNKPVIKLVSPTDSGDYSIRIPKDQDQTELNINIEDENGIKELKINGELQYIADTNTGKITVRKQYSLEGLEFITLSATDVYGNIANATYTIERIEVRPPEINLETPFASKGIIRINNDEKYLYLEGKVWDENKINTITVDDIHANFTSSESNPKFTASVDITNKSDIIISATDVYGNTSTQVFKLLKSDNHFSFSNPMGKTWVILIENSDYKEFPNLFGPKKDIEELDEAFSHYQIDKIIHKRNMSRTEMERFFAIELRDLVRANNVESLLIWYAGHGKYINDKGYWIPVDAKLNAEFDYYDINALKASLYSYTKLHHLLVVSDACEAGPTCNVAMRGIQEKSCDEPRWTENRSSQIFTSSNTEAASDNSLFTKAFANSLLNNTNDCISIEEIATNVTIIMNKHTSQKPVFGKIAGLEDQNGTFFFIPR